MKPIKLFFDTEFTGLHQNTTLISIGIVADNGAKFYAELTDYDDRQINDWIRTNVINNLHFNNRGTFTEIEPVPFNKSMKCKGDKQYVKNALNLWIDQFASKIEWVSDVCHYDFVLLIDLLYGEALSIPYGIINSACHDINQDIANYLNITEIEAFDYSREQLLTENNIKVEGAKHNSLYVAEVIKELYDLMNK